MTFRDGITPDDSPASTSSDARRRFLRGETGRDETRDLVRAALLAGGDAEPWSPPAVPEASYEAALDAVVAGAEGLAARVEAEERGAVGLAGELMALTVDEREAAVRQDPRYATWAAGEALREASLAAGPGDPSRAVELARLAVAAAGEPAANDTSAARRRADLAALAHGQLANALRVASDLRQSGNSLERAFELAAAGSGDPLVRARLQSLGASLRSDQSRFSESLELARRAAATYRRQGDRHRYGRTLLKQAAVAAYRDDLETACATLDEALEHMDESAEPRLAAVARNHRASYLERLGRLDQARHELDRLESQLDHIEAGDDTLSLDRGRLAWLRGRVAVHAGEAVLGEELLQQARRTFVERGVGYEAAQVAMELALVYAAAGRVADQRRLAEEMIPIFTSRDLHAEARAALRLYTDAARAEAAGERLIRQLASYLDRAQGRPGLQFDAG